MNWAEGHPDWTDTSQVEFSSGWEYHHLHTDGNRCLHCDSLPPANALEWTQYAAVSECQLCDDVGNSFPIDTAVVLDTCSIGSTDTHPGVCYNVNQLIGELDGSSNAEVLASIGNGPCQACLQPLHDVGTANIAGKQDNADAGLPAHTGTTARAWTNTDYPCDDGIVTTWNDRCADGICAGTPYGCAPTSCRPGVVGATDCSTCRTETGGTFAPSWGDRQGECAVNPLWCHIAGVCYADGDTNPAPNDRPGDSACQVCRPLGGAACGMADESSDCVSRRLWILLDDVPCDDWDERTHTDTCHHGACYGTLYDGTQESRELSVNEHRDAGHSPRSNSSINIPSGVRTCDTRRFNESLPQCQAYNGGGRDIDIVPGYFDAFPPDHSSPLEIAGTERRRWASPPCQAGGSAGAGLAGAECQGWQQACVTHVDYCFIDNQCFLDGERKPFRTGAHDCCHICNPRQSQVNYVNQANQTAFPPRSSIPTIP